MPTTCVTSLARDELHCSTETQEFCCYPEPLVDCHPGCTCDPDALFCLGRLPECLGDWQCRTPAHPDWICGSQQRCMPRPPEPPVELCSGPADCQVIIIINILFVSNI